MNTTLRLTPGDKVGIIACSDGIKQESKPKVDELIGWLEGIGLEVITAQTLLRRDRCFSGPPAERAAELNKLFANREVKAIFDISGGDSANQILPYLDYDRIRSSRTPFFGISDLSVVLNSIYTRSKVPAYHYQIMNLINDPSGEQKRLFIQTFFEGGQELYRFAYRWIRGERMDGVVVGGNVRCFLKLAGTPSWPHSEGKILLLEGLSGRANRVVSYLAQLDQTGFLKDCSGIILGSFTELEKYGEFPIVQAYITEITAGYGIPILKTDELGHGHHCKCIIIGRGLKVSGDQALVLE